MTVDRLVAAAAELGPVTLDARSVFDAHGFSDGELLAEWAGRAGLAPPRLVCRRALFVLAAPRIWKASSRARAIIGLRYDTDLPNPAVHRGYPAPIADGSALDEVAVSAPGAEVAAALALQAEALLPHDEDVLGAEVVPGADPRLRLRVRTEDGRAEEHPRREVLAWALGLGLPALERVSPEVVQMSFSGTSQRIRAALAIVEGWTSRRAVRRELFDHLDSIEGQAAPVAPSWDAFTAAIEATGIVCEYDDRQEDPSGDRALLHRIDLGEAVAHHLLFWEAPYDDEPPGWLELGLATTQDRLLRTVEWARSHPDRWTPRLVQGPVAPRAPWVSRSYW